MPEIRRAHSANSAITSSSTIHFHIIPFIPSAPDGETKAQNVSFSLITKQTSSSIKQRDDPRLPRQTIRRRLAVVAHTTTITITVCELSFAIINYSCNVRDVDPYNVDAPTRDDSRSCPCSCTWRRRTSGVPGPPWCPSRTPTSPTS